MKKWLVFYTKSRSEKKVYDFLEKRGYEVFLPMQKILRQWSDRKKKVETPLFNSYIFVRETEDKVSEIVQVPGIAWNIRYDNKPAVLRSEELEVIKRFLDSGLLVETGKAEKISVGDMVEAIDGPLKGLKGNVVRSSSGNKFSVLLESIRQNVIVEIDPLVLKTIK